MASESRSSTPAAVAVPDRRELTEIRCSKCGRLLARVSPRALRRGAVVELACRGCRRKSYLVGGVEGEEERTQ